jgi:hypothetical protein
MRTIGGPRCGKPLANSKVCGRPLEHPGKCMSEEAVAHANAQSVIYHRERNATRYASINAIKLARGCIDCGYAEHAEALDFDHRDPSLKVADIASMLNATWAAITAELDKCDVRCACCHRVKTHRKPDSTMDAGLST